MRSISVILSMVCGLIAIGLLWLGYIGIFEETQVVPDFESTPKEGWDYWMRLEFWHDVRAYGLWILLTLSGLIIPTVGFIRSGIPIPARKVTDWILLSISIIYLVYWSWGIAQALYRHGLDRALILPLIMFAGCLYGLLVFRHRARYQISQEAQQDAP